MPPGEPAKAIFERAALPNEVLGRIWGLSDREGKGSLDATEFIIAMHLVTSFKTRAMTALPSVLPPGLYEAAARRGAPPPVSNRGPVGAASAVPRQFTGPQRTQSPLAHPPYGTPPPISAQTTGNAWLITPQEKAKYDQFFNGIDTTGSGYLSGEQAVKFFSDSGLPEDTLAQIWDLADINSEGRLTREEFAVAMYLIRQQRSDPTSSTPLPAFLPPALVPPTMRNQPRPVPQPTAPTFDNAANSSQLPKSATEDLFGLDTSPEQAKSVPAPVQIAQTTGGPAAALNRSVNDPFGGSMPASPASPQRQPFAPQPTGPSAIFKPFMPSSAFGASLAAQHTGGSNASSQPTPRPAPAPPSVMDDLLGEAPEEETRNLNNDTTELANMSNQIGNLRTQMQQTQATKDTTQRDLTTTNTQKRDLEQRLAQFRAQYEQEVKTVKSLEDQLARSRSETQQLQQNLAMIEATYQDLTTQHQTVAHQLAADQQENANLKQRISQLNGEIAQLKPQIEKMKSDARQQKGMVAINKKQLATNESEREKLTTEMTSLKQEAEERERQQQQQQQQGNLAEQDHSRAVASPEPASVIASPAGSTSTNPFFRTAASPKEVSREAGSLSPGTFGAAAPTPSSFDALFGPSFTSQQQQPNSGTPPVTSFGSRDVPHSATSTSDGRLTPSATPPLSTTHDNEPPPPPESRQFTPANLPLRDLQRDNSFDSSVRAAAPGSIDHRSVATGPITSPFEGADGNLQWPSGNEPVQTPPAQTSGPAMQSLHADGFYSREESEQPQAIAKAEGTMPGAFPDEAANPFPAEASGQGEATDTATHDDFESAFAGFGDQPMSKGKEPAHDPFESVSRETQPANHGGFNDEFPEIRELDPTDDSDSESEAGFDDDFNAAPPQHTNAQDEPRAAEHVEEVAPAAFDAAPEEPLRPAITEEARTTTDLPPITAQTSPPPYDATVESPKSGPNGHVPPEFGGLLPSREDPTQSPVPHSVPTHTTSGAVPDGFPEAGSQPTDSTPAPAETAVTSNAQPKSAAFDDDFADFDDLAEANEATGEEAAFGDEPEIQGEEFNPTFDSPEPSVHTFPAPSFSQDATAASGSVQPGHSNGFSNFEGNVGQQQHSTIASPFASSEAPQAQNSHDWDAIFSGLDAPPSVNTDPAPESLGTSSVQHDGQPSTITSSAFPMPPNGGLSIPSADDAKEESSSSSSSAKKPELGRAITNTGEHDDPTVKRLVGMGFPREKAVKALEDYDYNIEKVRSN